MEIWEYDNPEHPYLWKYLGNGCAEGLQTLFTKIVNKNAVVHSNQGVATALFMYFSLL